MSDDEFEKHKEAVAVKRLEKPKKLSTLSSVFWREIVSQLYHFDRDNVEVEYLRTLKKQDIIEHYKVSFKLFNSLVPLVLHLVLHIF